MAKKPAVPSKDHARPTKGTEKPESTTDAPASSQPRRSERGRQLRNLDEENGAKRPNGAQSGPSLPKPRKTIPNETSESEPTTSTSRRRGAGRNARDPDEGRPVDPKEADAQPTNKAKSKKQVESAREETNSARQGADDKKRRLRPPANAQENTQEDTPQSRKANKEKTNKTKSQDLVAGGTEAGPSVRRGRPRASAPSAQEVDTGGPSESRAPLREEGSNTVKRSRQKKEAPPKPHQNESSTEDEASEDSEDEPDFPFRYLKQEMRTVARSTIASKWNRLDAPAINVVSSFLTDAQRPVLFRLQDTNRRREHASAAMGVASRRIRTRLTRGLPFPAPTMGASSRAHPKSYEDEFDFERTVDTMQNLENTLNPLLHSISLLEKEIKKQEDALAKDYNSLHKLEHNARSKTREWREKAKREHALAPGVRPRDGEPRRELGDKLELVPPVDDRAIGGVFITVRQDGQLTSWTRAGTNCANSAIAGSPRRGAGRALEADWQPHGELEEQLAAGRRRCARYYQKQSRPAAGATEASGRRTVR